MSNAELNNLKKQMVIKLGTTTNDESAIISNMVDGASAGSLPAVSADDNGKVLKVVDGVWTKAEGGGSIPSCDVTLINTGAEAYELTTDLPMLSLNTNNVSEASITYNLEPNEPVTLKFGLINIAPQTDEVRVNMVGLDFILAVPFETEDYSNVYTNLDNVDILINASSLPGSLDIYYVYIPVVIDINKPASCTLTMDFNNL